MSRSAIAVLVALLALSIAAVFGALHFLSYRPCTKAPVPLFRDLLSQQTQRESQRGLPATAQWRVEKDHTRPPDGRPRFDFVLVDVGQMTHLGHSGDTKLWFYNDRLMSVYFSPEDPAAYFGAVEKLAGARRDHETIALAAGARVRRVGAIKDGPMIEWYDPCLEDEHGSWIMDYS